MNLDDLKIFIYKIFKQTRQKKCFCIQQGQALVEYVLMLCISVLLIVGVIYQLNKDLKTFIDEYFSEYIACLLETGELPGSQGSCSVPEYKSNIALSSRNNSTSSSSNPNKSPNKNGSSNDSISGKDDKDDKDDKDGKDKNGNDNENNTELSKPANASNIRSSSPSSRFSNFSRNSSRESVGGDKAKKGAYTGSTEAKSGKTSEGFSDSQLYSRNHITSIGAWTENEEKEKSKKETIRSVASLHKDVLRNPKIKIEPKIQKRIYDNDTNFSIGDFLRIILIAAIIIAIVVLIGGQAVQINKNMK